jgi:tetratricopeptide (TPR) repeat protein
MCDTSAFFRGLVQAATKGLPVLPSPSRPLLLPALILAALLAPSGLAAQTAAAGEGSAAVTEGERLFRENRPAEALPLLEQATREGKGGEAAWLWLAYAYQQTGRLEDAISTLRKGAAKATERPGLFWYNLGNLYSLQGKAAFAKEMYDSAIAAEPSLAGAWLNRANASLLLKDTRQAREDYSRYLVLEPGSSQRERIQALIGLLGEAIGDEERQKAIEEAAKAAADAARKSLLDEVSASLRAAAEETTNLAAGSGQVQGYVDELPASD